MKLNIILLISFSALLISCEAINDINDRTIVGEGPVVAETLDLDSFSKIANSGVANFYITIGSPQSVILKAQQNIIDVMTYEVKGQTLDIGLEKNVSIENHEEIRFEITIPTISEIELTGVGDFYLSGDDQDELTINFTGVGNVESFDMKVGSCYITLTGVGNCEVYVTDVLDVTITGVGNVYYKGTPAITSSITGLGQLINSN